MLPYLFLPSVPLDTAQINNGIMPITVNEINNHQPDLFTSWSLLTPTAMPGKKITIFTDGACVNNGKRNAKGGVGIYYQDNYKPNVSISLKDSKPTNNKAELTAIKMMYKT